MQDVLKSLLEMLGVSGSGDETNDSFQEIQKLDGLLTEAGIPHDFFPHFLGAGFQLVYYGHKGKPQPQPGVTHGPGVGAVCSAVETNFSYGHENDRIEIAGLLSEEEKRELLDTVKGNLTAEDVFERIKKHWMEEES